MHNIMVRIENTFLRSVRVVAKVGSNDNDVHGGVENKEVELPHSGSFRHFITLVSRFERRSKFEDRELFHRIECIMAHLHLQELGGFGNAPCDIVFVTLFSVDLVIGLEFKDF